MGNECYFPRWIMDVQTTDASTCNYCGGKLFTPGTLRSIFFEGKWYHPGCLQEAKMLRLDEPQCVEEGG